MKNYSNIIVNFKNKKYCTSLSQNNILHRFEFELIDFTVIKGIKQTLYVKRIFEKLKLLKLIFS